MESQIPKCYFIIHAQWGKAACSPMGGRNPRAQSIRSRAERGIHPHHAWRARISELAGPSAGMRAQWREHFSGPDAAQAARVPDARRTVLDQPMRWGSEYPRMAISDVLWAFGFRSRARAEELGREAYALDAARASANAVGGECFESEAPSEA